MRHLLPAVIASTATFLQACGGGGAAPTNTYPTIGSSFALSNSDTVSARSNLAHSSTILNAKTTNLRVKYTDQSITALGADTATVDVNVSKSGDLSLILTALGQLSTFNLGDLSAGVPNELSGIASDGNTQIYFWVFEDTWQQVFDGAMPSRFHVSFGTSTFDPSTQINDRGYGVVGLRTPLAAIDSKASATYTGPLRMDSFLVSDPTFLFQIYGDVQITANFNAGKISGSIDNMIVGDLPQTSGLLIHEGTINGTQYATTVGYDPTTCGLGGCGAINASALNGEFFGNVAQETGGTLVFEGVSSDGHEYIAAGAFETAE